MPQNFYLDNADLKFHLRHVDLEEAVRLREEDFQEVREYPDAPENFADAVDGYEQVLEMLGEICGEQIWPRSRSVDAEGATFAGGRVRYAAGTDENLKDLKQAQLMGVTLPRKYGGLNFPLTGYAMMIELVSRADASLQNLFGLQDIAETIQRYGSEDQRARYLPRFASGEVDGAMALTEPEAGSDLQSVQLKATLDPATNRWYLNGMKRFITNGCAKVHLVLARSEEGTKDGRGLSMFICEAGPWLEVRRIEEKFGIHGSPTCELQFRNAPAELVGQRRRGLTRYVMSLMNGARVAVAAQAVGVAEAAYREALAYARAREQFGQTIDRFPAVYEMLVRSRVQIAAGRALLYETTKYVDLRDEYERLIESGDPARVTSEVRERGKAYSRIAAVLTPLSKAFCAEMANQVAYDGLQVHGGTGYMKDFNAERLARDARITNIYEGTTQLQHVAAVGGVVQRILEPLMTEVSHLPFQGKLRRLASAVDVAREKLNRAVADVEGRKDAEYFGLMSRRLCQMETVVFVGYLLLRDALADGRREALAERFILEGVRQVEADFAAVVSGDLSLIDRREEILGL
ncbi:MAG: acyl-CoA dehydrogenase family protein [Deltaproteobacteria bacterium]|nr:acyl-CoA dehydrogenase family protein [Deltaproteobacteria bacterium]